MITFNELRIAEDGSCLIVDCEIENVDIYKDMYIKSVYLEYYKNANPSLIPSDKAYKMYENTSNNSSVQAVRLSLPVTSSALGTMGIGSFDNGLFYVIVDCDGDLPAKTALMPCGYDEQRKIGAILDWRAFYEKGMSYVTSLFGACNPCPDYTDFEHFAVLWEALKMALSVCDWNLVAELWDRFLLHPEGAVSVPAASRSGCGCR
jgi:hypothetical protein